MYHPLDHRVFHTISLIRQRRNLYLFSHFGSPFTSLLPTHSTVDELYPSFYGNSEASIMSLHQPIPTTAEPLHCSACDTIHPGNPDVEWYSWTSPMGIEVFCSICLGDPGQHWGEKLFLFRMASFGRGSPEGIHSLLDQIGQRRGFEEDKALQSFIGGISYPMTKSSHRRYQYSPLCMDSDHIRILCLHPSTNHNARVECSIEAVALDHYSDFTAVSYAWGESKAEKLDIFVEGSNGDWASFEVLQNLHQLLRQMRHPKKVRRLWVDAICINQGRDDEAISERNAQVNLMRRIYRQASNVMIWLGLEENDSTFVIETIQQRDIVQMQGGRFWKGMVCILRRPWFQRTWIIQELALNEKSPYLLIGQSQISWIRLMAGFSFMSFVIPDLSGFDEVAKSSLFEAIEISNLHVLSSIRTDSKRDGGAIIERPIYRLLLRSRNFKATDARDRVYGLRGLISERLLSELPVDYKKPVEHIYQDAVQFMLKHEEGVQLFAQFPLPLSLGEKVASWPSWVPDFNSTGKGLQSTPGDANWHYRYPFRPFDFEIQTRGDRHHPQGPKPAVNAGFQGHKLIAQGISIDFITNLAKSKILPDTNRTAFSEHQKLLEELETFNDKTETLKTILTTLGFVIQKAGTLVSSTDFRDARDAYMSTLSMEERIRLRVREILKRAQAHLFTIASSKAAEGTPLEGHNDEMVGANDETLSLAANAFFDQVKADISSRSISSEEKEASLSTLARSIEQENVWKSPIEALSEQEIIALSEQVSALSEASLIPGPDVIHLANKFIDLCGQTVLMGDQRNAILSKSAQCISKLREVQAKMNSYLVSVVESLAAVNDVYTEVLLGQPNHEWATELWHNLLDGYDNLTDLSPETFRQAFFDMVGSTSPPIGSIDRRHEAPRYDQPVAKLLNRAMRHVFHEKTQFMICQRTKLYGLTTNAAKEGDMLVFLFPPWYMPMVLRRVEGSDDYYMVGPAIFPSARRMSLLGRYKSFGLLQDKKLSTFSII